MTSYRNPIVPGFNPDPSIIRVGEDYFLCTSTFEYFPAVPIYHSRDLISWNLIGHALTRRSQLDLRTLPPGIGICAPTLRYHNKRYYMTTCCMWKLFGRPGDPMVPPRGFYVWTDDIWDSSSWSEPIFFDVTGIDQDLFFDEDGKSYLSIAKPIFPMTNGFRMGSYTCEVDLETGKSLSRLQLNRETHVKDPIAEGPHLFRRGGYYYLHTAEGGTETNHQQWIFRSEVGPYGPWEIGPEGSVNPMIHNGDHPEVMQTGHMDLVEGADGRWWAVFLAVRPQVEGHEKILSQLGRETFLCPVEWKDDWPIVNDRQPVSVSGIQAAGLVRSPAAIKQAFIFSPSTNLALEGWYSLRTPIKTEHSLSLRPGSLAIFGGPYELRADEAITMFLQKQTAFTGVWEAEVDFEPEEPQQEAGTTVWWSKWSFASIAIRGTESGREVVFRYPNAEGDDFREECTPLSTPGPVGFQVIAEPTKYSFNFTPRGGTPQAAGTIPSRVLVRTREFDSIMTGTHLGLYAIGANGQAASEPAFFFQVSWTARREGY